MFGLGLTQQQIQQLGDIPGFPLSEFITLVSTVFGMVVANPNAVRLAKAVLTGLAVEFPAAASIIQEVINALPTS